MSVLEKVYTAADLWALSHEYPERRFELCEGMLIEMSPTGGKHGGLGSKLDRTAGVFVEQNELGYTTAAETGYVLFTDPVTGKATVRAPDFAFVAAACLPDGLPDSYMPLAPDFAVEIVSPNDKPDDIASKINDYIRYGVKLFWFIYPAKKMVHVYTPPQMIVKTIDDTLDGGTVLPGFKLTVSELFRGI
jgi:Uma2 family endonuclease